MEMRKCEICGEEYSTTYRSCPFCEEEEALRKGKPIHRHTSDFRNKRGGHGLGVLALVLALVVIGAGAVHFFGDNIAQALGIRDAEPVSDPNQISTVTAPDGDNPAQPSVDSGPDGGDGENDPNAAVEPVVDPAQKPDTAVMLSSEDFTMSSAGEQHVLTAAGGSGAYTWSVKDANVATVSEDGTVTAVGGGNTEVTVTDGYTTAVCIVRVKGPAANAGGSTAAPSGTLALNREDMTMPAGTTFQLKVSGTSSAVTWSIADTSVATIGSDGTVKFLSRGTTTATASVDGQTLQCIVRVK